jgi:Fic family protein
MKGPIETMIYRNQQAYYNALNKSETGFGPQVFVEFMLDIIKFTIESMPESRKVYKKDKLANRLPNVGKDVGKDVGKELTRKVLKTLVKDGNQTATFLAKKFNVSTRTIKRIFAKLKEEGKLKRINGRKSGYWEVID